MDRAAKRKLVMPLIILLVLTVSGVTGIYKGIAQHQTWRIAIASIGVVLSLVGGIIIAYGVFKKNKSKA